MIQSTLISSAILVSAIILCISEAQGRTLNDDDSVSPVLPSPNQDYGDQLEGDIQRMNSAVPATQTEFQQEASNEAIVPVYVSPFVRAERSSGAPLNFDHQESSHAPPNYAPRPSASAHSPATRDLKTSASYGHHHHGGHHGYDHSGWLDMGAWTGGKGAFGWYADYPVGGKHHGYGRR